MTPRSSGLTSEQALAAASGAYMAFTGTQPPQSETWTQLLVAFGAETNPSRPRIGRTTSHVLGFDDALEGLALAVLGNAIYDGMKSAPTYYQEQGATADLNWAIAQVNATFTAALNEPQGRL